MFHSLQRMQGSHQPQYHSSRRLQLQNNTNISQKSNEKQSLINNSGGGGLVFSENTKSVDEYCNLLKQHAAMLKKGKTRETKISHALGSRKRPTTPARTDSRIQIKDSRTPSDSSFGITGNVSQAPFHSRTISEPYTKKSIEEKNISKDETKVKVDNDDSILVGKLSGRKARWVDRQSDSRSYINSFVTKDGVMITNISAAGRDSSVSIIPVVSRNDEARAQNPERVNLMHMNFEICPIIDNEPNIRMLNLQSNQIKYIGNLHALPNLVFLDLSGNQIGRLSNLECLVNLRVLQMANNQIREIENLDALSKLDVLDLSGNKISVIDNLTKLQSLRVLNLSGNRIRVLDTSGLNETLQELYLKRNHINEILDTVHSSCIVKLVLSNNQVKPELLETLYGMNSLNEVILMDNDPLKNVDYRPQLVTNMVNLNSIDEICVTEEERNRILASLEPDTPQVTETENQTSEDEMLPVRIMIKSFGNSCRALDMNDLMSKYLEAEKVLITDALQDQSTNARGFHRIEDAVVEICGNADVCKTLKLPGNIRTMTLNAISVDEIVISVIPYVAQNPDICKIILKQNAVESYPALARIVSALPSQINALDIVQDPVTSLKMYRPWVFLHCDNGLLLDGLPMSEADERLGRLLPQPRREARKESIDSIGYDAKTRLEVVNGMIASHRLVDDLMVNAAKKVKEIERLNTVFDKIVREAEQEVVAENTYESSNFRNVLMSL